MMTHASVAFRPSAGLRFGAEASDRNARIDRHLAVTETPAFRLEFAAVLARAKDWILSQKRQGQTGFVIFDIDETVLDNRGYFAEPGYYKKAPGKAAIHEAWDRWVQSSRSPALPPSKALIEWLEAEKIPYLFLTGIEDKHYSASTANLRKAGVWKSNCLGAFYKPAQWRHSTTQFKKEARAKLERDFGMPMLATIGDRPGDMTDDPRKNFLLPDYVAALRRENDHG